MAPDAGYRLVTPRRTLATLQKFDGRTHMIPAAQCKLRALISGS